MRRRMVWSIGSLALMLALIMMSARNVRGEDEPPFTLTTFTVPTTGSNSWGITAGPDSNLWFAESGASKIGRITPSGTITGFSIPTPNSGASSITPGPDGNLWFTEDSVSKIGRITPSGTITEFPVPTTSEVVAEDETSGPYDIVSGPDKNLWVSTYGGHPVDSSSVFRVAPDGRIIDYDTISGYTIAEIAAGPDGAIWFTSEDTIGRLQFPVFYQYLPLTHS